MTSSSTSVCTTLLCVSVRCICSRPLCIFCTLREQACCRACVYTCSVSVCSASGCTSPCVHTHYPTMSSISVCTLCSECRQLYPNISKCTNCHMCSRMVHVKPFPPQVVCIIPVVFSKNITKCQYAKVRRKALTYNCKTACECTFSLCVMHFN